MKEFEAVELIGDLSHNIGFIISIDKDNFCKVIGSKINMKTPIYNLRPLGFTLQEFLNKCELIIKKEYII